MEENDKTLVNFSRNKNNSNCLPEFSVYLSSLFKVSDRIIISENQKIVTKW